MKLTYKFNNDEKKINIDKKEFLVPKNVEFYFQEGDKIFVKDGDYVYINQLLIEKVSGIKEYATIAGTVSLEKDSIVVTNDNTDSSMKSSLAIESIDNVSKEEIFDVCKQLGIAYKNKLILNKLKRSNCRVLVINGMDVEPYQFNNNYLFQDNVKNLLDTINLLSRRFNLDSYLLLNKYDDNNVYAAKTLLGTYPNINFIVVPEVFPYNTDGVILKKYFKEYKEDEILLLDTVSLYKIFVALKDKLPVKDKYITITLDDSTKSYVVKTRYGVRLKEMLENVIGNLEDKDFYLNNFMRKVKCRNIDDVIITDNINSVFIFPHSEEVESKCIKCGKCIDICPMGLNPRSKKLDANCIRCGLCNYVCPANINLLSREKDEL